MAKPTPKFATIYKNIYKKHEEIEEEQTIPKADVPLLVERLIIVCTDNKRKRQRKEHGREPLSNVEKLNLSRERISQRLYLKILDKQPGIFLAFILTVSPRVCTNFDFQAFCKQHNEQSVVLSDDAESLFWQIAVENGIQKSQAFQKITNQYFTLPRPSTGTEEEENCSLSLSNLPMIRIAFGNVICDAVECSPTHRPMNANGGYADTTQCIRTTVFYNHQDTTIYVDVGRAVDLAELLFPSASRKINSNLSTQGSKAALPPGMQSESLGTSFDFAYFTLRGASVAGIRSVFSTSICEAIENCELRRWEKRNLLTEVTDCVTMQLWRAEAQHGIIKLRVGHYTGVNLANKLYAETR